MNYRDFPVQLTKWLNKDGIIDAQVSCLKHYGKNSYGRIFITKKKNRWSNKEAIFVKADNKFRRTEDKMLQTEIPFHNLLLCCLHEKQAGVPIWKTLLKKLI